MRQRGFVFMELIIVFAIVAILVGIAVVNILGSKRKASLTGTIDPLVADIRSQQTKAMEGAIVNGAIEPAFGIYFASNQYVLFNGAAYKSSDNTNSVVPLDSRVTFNTISLPGNVIVFASKSGEVVGYATNSSTLSLKEIDSGETQTIKLNHYGVITSVQ